MKSEADYKAIKRFEILFSVSKRTNQKGKPKGGKEKRMKDYMSTFEFLLNMYLDDLGYINRKSWISELILKHKNPLDEIPILLSGLIAENPLI